MQLNHGALSSYKIEIEFSATATPLYTLLHELVIAICVQSVSFAAEFTLLPSVKISPIKLYYLYTATQLDNT